MRILDKYKEVLRNTVAEVQARLRGDAVTPERASEKPKPARKPVQSPFDKRTPLSWLTSVVSGIDLGLKVESKDRNSKHPIHLNTSKEILEHFRRLHRFGGSWLRNRWSRRVLADHCKREKTSYFAGANESLKSHTLVMIDVDCHGSGSKEGAMAYLQYLRDHHFPSLYFEVSTNGNGGHGYFLLDKEGMGAAGLKPILSKQLEPWLNELANGFEVENVEVKGLPPEIEWGKEKFEVEAYTAGTLAKLPWGLLDRFDELRNTTVVKATDLRRLAVVKPQGQEVSVSKSRDQKSDSKQKVKGSISGHHFSEKELSGLREGGVYHCVATELLSNRNVKTSGRQKIIVEDVAIVLMVGEFFFSNPNPDGSLPTARWAAMWKALYDEGDVPRPWEGKRFSAIRNLLSSLGLIDWQDPTYCLGFKTESGEYVKGKAAKWRFSEQLIDMLKDDEEIVSKDCATSDSEKGEKHPLKEQLIQNTMSMLIQLPESETMRPRIVFKTLPYRYSPAEIDSLVVHVCRLAA